MASKHASPKKRAKKYVKRTVNPYAAADTVFKTLERAATQADALAHVEHMKAHPINDLAYTELGIANHGALKSMVAGTGTEDDWNTVVCCLNTALVLCENDIGKEYEQDVVKALDGAFRAKLRADKTGKWGFDGPALNAINYAFELHDEQMKIATQMEVVAALIEVKRRVDAGIVYRDGDAQQDSQYQKAA